MQSAKSALDLANSRLTRDQQLANQNFVSAARVDETRSQQQQAFAQWEAAQSQLKLSQQPLGRNAELLAAQDDFKATQSVAAQKQWLVEHSISRAGLDGELVDTFFRAGEWVAAGKPVASLLPDSGRLVRFFVPEPLLAQLKTGQTIQVRCDGCTAPVSATIESISSRAEYTPPVIYSKDRRDKLVFRVDARPTGSTLLPPGLPVDIALPGL